MPWSPIQLLCRSGSGTLTVGRSFLAAEAPRFSFDSAPGDRREQDQGDEDTFHLSLRGFRKISAPRRCLTKWLGFQRAALAVGTIPMSA